MLGSFSGGGLGMGIAFSLYDDFTNTANDIERSMGGLGEAADSLEDTINSSMNMMAIGAAALSIGLGALFTFHAAEEVRAEFQAFEVMFTTLLGSADRASKFFNQIKNDAKDNPVFGTKSLVGANAALTATGRVAEEQSRRIVNNLAEILAGVGAGDAQLSGMAVNLQQIGNNGKASGMDIKQFGMAGVPIMKLLQDSTGKTAKELEGVDITLQQLDEAFAHATAKGQMFYQASDRAAQSTKGLKAAMEDNIELIWERLGAAIEPMTRAMYTSINTLTNSVLNFISSPLGAAFARAAYYGAIFLTVLGGLLLITGLLRFSVYKLAGAFGDVTKAEILATIASKGATAGFKQMAAAAWASLGPYIYIAIAIGLAVAAFYKLNQMLSSNQMQLRNWAYLILFAMGPVGWLIGGIMAMIQGVKDFDGYLAGTTKKLSGIAGWFQQLGGVIRGVIEIFETYDQKTDRFSLSAKLEAGLRNLGILEFVIAVGTYIARLMSLFRGFKDGLKEAMEIAKNVAISVLNALSPMSSKMESWRDALSKATSDMKTWYEVGRYIGLGLLVIFAALAAIIVVLGIAAVISLAVIVIVLGTIAVMIWALYKVVMFLVDAFAYLWDAMVSFFTGSVDLIAGSLNYINDLFTGIITSAFNWGRDMMTNLWEGIKAVWGSIVGWVSDKFHDFKVAIGIEDASDRPEGIDSSGAVNNRSAGVTRPGEVQNRQAAMSTFSNNIFTMRPSDNPEANKQGGPATIVIPIHIGNEQVGEHVIDYIQGKESRR